MDNPGNDNNGEHENRSRMLGGAVPSAPYYGQGWNAGGAGNYLPQPPIPVPVVPHPGGGGGGYPQFGYPPAPPNSVTGGGGGMYPNIGFNPALLNPTASSVTCPNAAEGCPEVIPGHLLTSHLKVCEFRSFPFCSKYFGWTDCQEKVGRSTLVRHLCDNHQVVETQHAKFTLELIAPSQLLHNQTTPPSSSSAAAAVQQEQQQGVVWSPLVIKSDMLDGDHVLLRCFISPRGYLSLAGYLLESRARSNGTEWKRYRIKFQLESLSKIARLEWTGRLIFHRFHDYDDTGTGIHPSGQFASNVNTFRIPVSSLIQEYMKPVGGGGAGNSLEEVEYHHHHALSSKIKVKVCVWKHNGDDAEPPYQKCFQEEESLEKLTLFSSEQGGGGGGSRAFALTADEMNDYNHFYASPRMAASSVLPAPAAAPAIQYSQEEYSNYYSLDSRCSRCSRHLYGDVIYQCLQCHSDNSLVATYFCRNCIEVGHFHQEHLTMRISKPSLQPLAAVAYECSAGELH